MYTFTGLSAFAGEEELFSNLNIALEKGRLICLTGPNGSGKTTLVKSLFELAVARGMNPLYFDQKSTSSNTQSPGESRGDELFIFLGDTFDRDFILLDEPGNHLDNATFERFLFELQRLSHIPALVVTHDRRLLRRADQILHLEEGKLERYGGGYDLYIKQRSELAYARIRQAHSSQRAANEAQKSLSRNVEKQRRRRLRAEDRNQTQKNPKSLVNMQRNRADKTDARIEATHKKLKTAASEKAKIAMEARVSPGREFELKLESEAPVKHGLIVSAFGLNVDLPQRKKGRSHLWEAGLSFQIMRGMRTAICGKNGSGKTTLLNIIAGLTERYVGELHNETKRIFYMKQIFDAAEGERIIDYHLNFRKEYDEGQLRTMLANAGFRGDEIYLALKNLSGGELCRLQLARAAIMKADLILFDEPTNDLDARAREELVRVINETEVPFVVVSHDEEFLSEIGIDNRINLE